MRLRLTCAIAVSLAAAGMYALSELQRVSVPLPGAVVEINGTFVDQGAVPSGAKAPGGGKYWSSWVGDDRNTGSLAHGPFPAPRALRFRLMGYPQVEGNRLVFENTVTGEVFKPALDNAGESWRRATVPVPDAWRGQLMRIRLTDGATSWGGWMAITEIRAVPWWAAWWTNVWPVTNGLLFCGVGVLLTLGAAARVLQRWPSFRGPGLLLLSAALVALLSYVLFWVYFFAPVLGTFAMVATFGLAAWLNLVCSPEEPGLWRDPDWRTPLLLTALAAVLYVSLLTLFPDVRPLSDLAANRYREGLPSDNTIPYFFAERIRWGSPLKPFFGDWLSSDRPPLEAGWTLLFAPLAPLLGSSYNNSAQLAGVWFQLLWIPAVWFWLRAVGVTPRPAAWLIVAVVPTGFFIINSVYVWPKLGAGALMLGAFVLWQRRPHSLPAFAAGGALAALGWLAHGGVAFALIALAPWVVFSWRRLHLRPWLAAGVAFAALALSWICYQNYYDPPGNRLLKWHIAGSIPIDDRGTLETLAHSYQTTPVHDLLENRRQNLRALFFGPWRQLLTFDFREAQSRRDHEFFYTFFALGWWNAGWVALAALAVPGVRRRLPTEELRGLLGSLGWVGLTLVVWLALMFLPWTTVIHQGSYTTLLVALPALALLLWRIHPALWAGVAGAQLAAFPLLWMSPPPGLAHVDRQPAAVALVVLALLGLAVVSGTAGRTPAASPHA